MRFVGYYVSQENIAVAGVPLRQPLQPPTHFILTFTIILGHQAHITAMTVFPSVALVLQQWECAAGTSLAIRRRGTSLFAMLAYMATYGRLVLLILLPLLRLTTSASVLAVSTLHVARTFVALPSPSVALVLQQWEGYDLYCKLEDKKLDCLLDLK